MHGPALIAIRLGGANGPCHKNDPDCSYLADLLFGFASTYFNLFNDWFATYRNS